MKEFGVSHILPPEIKRADIIALATERRDIMPDHPSRWEILEGVEPLKEKIHPLLPTQARTQFLMRYYELIDKEGTFEKRKI